MNQISDLESPGYEYLRSYQNMNNLYQKLLILNYQQDFCSIYRCPPIHRYYFSMPSKNQSEQQFYFTCLCAWLIKDKCQMNLELEPEEYEDREITLSVIVEALRLLLTPDEDIAMKRDSSKNLIGFAPAKLRSGFGPEVIWTINILADRALEVLSESESKQEGTQILYHNTQAGSVDSGAATRTCITIGQPFVGGGLTTRPLGSYQVDDASLLLEEDAQNPKVQSKPEDSKSTDLDPAAWYRRVERAAPALNSANLAIDEGVEAKNWQRFLKSIEESRGAIEEFMKDSKYLLDPILNKVEKQLKVISERERLIQVKLKIEIENFLMIWRTYSLELAREATLLEKINNRTDKFDHYNDRLRRLNSQIESRMKELNDGSRLRELEVMINRLKEENAEFDIKIGLLLTVYAAKRRKIVSESSAS